MWFLTVSDNHSHTPQYTLMGYSSDSLSFIPFYPFFISYPKVLQSHPPPILLLACKSVSRMDHPPVSPPPLKPSVALTPLINWSKCLCLAFRAFHVLTPTSMLCSRLSEQLGVPRTWNPQAFLKCTSPWPGWHSFKGLPHSSSLNACFSLLQ